MSKAMWIVFYRMIPSNYEQFVYVPATDKQQAKNRAMIHIATKMKDPEAFVLTDAREVDR
ncbi:hypothetical protein [Bacillus phage Anath]|uniref:Uncharacterized protein n=1 Tax=Bacillus phage Anath TaxID=2108114 RepID=A0A2P1JUP6_9CAUD|nr:hypothetical protein [Bacillus phage Anath]